MKIFNPETGEYVEFFRKQNPIKLEFEDLEPLPDVIEFHHGYISLPCYHLGDNPEFEKALSVWDQVSFKYRRMAGYYIKELNEFRLPRAFDTGQLAKFFPNRKPVVINDPYPSDKIPFALTAPPRDDEQRVALSFLCCQGDFKKNSRFTTLMLAQTVGTGKTFAMVAASAFLRARTVVILPISKLVDQWKQSYLNFTSIQEDEILIVRGSNKCEEIRQGLHDDKKIFIFMIQTIRSYVEEYGNLKAIEMFRRTNAYLKICDEIHRELKAVCMVEALCNFHMNYYASATPKRSGSKEGWIFKTCFRNCPRFGENFKTTDEKWTNIMIAQYSFVPTPAQTKRMINARTKWLNSKLYEKELVHSPESQLTSFNNTVKSMLTWSKSQVKRGNKILILCTTIDGTEYMKQLAEEIFPGKVSTYTGKMKSSEQKEALTKDIICATSQSLGTGADIKKIQHVYMIGTYNNPIDAGQLPGRARKLDDGQIVVYIEVVNVGWQKTYRQFEKRKPYLIQASKTGKLFMIQ